MPRPRKCRNVSGTPEVTYFKPRGVPLRELAEVYLPLDGFEAIRLADFEGLGQEEAAEQMQVSRQTFGRILASARETVAKALVQGMALRIHGRDDRTTFSEDQERESLHHDGEGGPDASGPPRTEDIVKECQKMKTIAISSEGPTLDDLVDPRFGRAAGFIVIDPETMDFEYVDNGAGQARTQGAGIQAAETVSQAGVEGVLTGFVGPKAFQALAATNIKVAQDLENITVRDAVERFKQGRIQWAELSQAKGMGQGRGMNR